MDRKIAKVFKKALKKIIFLLSNYFQKYLEMQ